MAPFSYPTCLAGPNQIRDAWLPLYYFIKNMRKRFHSQIFAEAISIWGKPINIYEFNAIPRSINISFLQKYNFYKSISSLFKMIYKMDVQSSNCFYKISMFKRNGVNAYVGEYFSIISL